MGDYGETWVDQGWDPKRFFRRLDRRYEIQDRETGRWTKFGQLFQQSRPQVGLAKLILKRIKRGGPIRIVVDKSRKAGISSLVAALGYDLCTTLPGYNAGVMAHVGESTDILFRMTWNYWWRTDPALRPEKKRLNGTLFEFGTRYIKDHGNEDKGLGSIYECKTAGGDNPFTAGTLRFLHCSEMGKWPGDMNRQMQTWTSLMGAVPDNGPSLIIAESTAQGEGNLFHKIWLEAQENVRNGREPNPGEWEPYFIGCQDDPLNRAKVPQGYQWEDWPEEDVRREQALLAKYFGNNFVDASEFLYWRRTKLKAFAMDANRFDEEQPHCWEVSFVAGGQPAIPRHLFDYLENCIADPAQVYTTRLVEADDVQGKLAVEGW